MDRKALDARRQGDGASHPRASPLDRFHDLARRLIYDPVVISLQPYSDALSRHIKEQVSCCVYVRAAGLEEALSKMSAANWVGTCKKQNGSIE